MYADFPYTLGWRSLYEQKKGLATMDAQEQHDELMLRNPLTLNSDASQVLKDLLRTNAAAGPDPSAQFALTPSEMQVIKAGMLAAQKAPQGLLDAIGF